MPRTLLGLLNYLILQWLWIRLAKAVDDDGHVVYWMIMTGVYPLSGWGKPYKLTKGHDQWIL